MRRHGVPDQILTDNGKVFTGRFGPGTGEVLFDRICRENGIDHLLTAPRSPTTTGKVERCHKTVRAEFLTDRLLHPSRRRKGSWMVGLRIPPANARLLWAQIQPQRNWPLSCNRIRDIRDIMDL
jgi:transposase InsO family protein